MGKIKVGITTYLNDLEQKGTAVEFCNGFLPQACHGQDSKLAAGVAVQNYLFKNGMNSQSPLPLHKNHSFFKESLRQRAKQKVNSQVGEIYGPKQIEQVLSYNSFQVDSYRMEQKSAYEKFLIKALNQKNPVIAYFDVLAKKELPNAGDPVIFNGNFEHAAAIGGYYYWENKLHLIVAQWGEYFDILFDDLYSSTSQLNKLKQPEHFQKYYPIPGKLDRKTWLEKEQMNHELDQIGDGKNRIKRNILSLFTTLWPKSAERISTPPQGEEASLANILTVITGDNAWVDLDEFQGYLVANLVSSSEEMESIRL